MTPTSDHRAFLASVDALNDKFAGIRYGDQWEPLRHPFWRLEKVLEDLELRDEWGVDSRFAPFYGDWHTLLCLDLKDAGVVYLDDSRTVVYRWRTTDAFLASLTIESPPSAVGGPKLLSVHLSPEFRKRAAEILAAKSRKKKNG